MFADIAVSARRRTVGVARRRYTPPTGGGVCMLSPRKRPLPPGYVPSVAVQIPIRSNNPREKPSMTPPSSNTPPLLSRSLSLSLLSFLSSLSYLAAAIVASVAMTKFIGESFREGPAARMCRPFPALGESRDETKCNC